MVVYTTHEGGKYFSISQSLNIDSKSLRNVYINMTNRCNCDCVFCLRHKKIMPQDLSLWLEREPTNDEIKKELENVPWHIVNEIVFCGFGEPTLRLKELIDLLNYIKKVHPMTKTRLNTNGLGELFHGRDISAEFENILDVVSISLNATTSEKYFKITRPIYGIKSFEAVLTFAEHIKNFVPQVILTVVDQVTSTEDILVCEKICNEHKLKLRVRPYESN